MARRNKNRAAVIRKPRSKDYLKIVEWSGEDGCFVGSAPPIIGPACHGPDKAEVYRQICVIVEEWLAIMEQDGIPIPVLTVRPTKRP